MSGLDGKLHFVIYANSITASDSMAGGYRILIECLRHWLNWGHTAELLTSQQGQRLVQRYLQSPNLTVQLVGPTGPPNDPALKSLWWAGVLNLLRTLKGVINSFFAPSCESRTVIYSPTPFWTDVLPAWIRHLRSPDTVWLVAFSMFAPPIIGNWLRGTDSKARSIEWRAAALKINEIGIYGLVKRWADLIYVNNQQDQERIWVDGVPVEKTLVIGGGIDVELSDAVQPESCIENEAVFIGRFHPQKGVLELIDIWQKVCQTLPPARLVMIGNGPLESAVAQKIKRLGLEKNIRLAGFQDGVDKIRIFRRSRIVLHPSLYDSGGMAAAEAMVCGLPGVSYDLPALKIYYPHGMLKAKDEAEFVQHVLHLLTDPPFYQATGHEAEVWARTWDWRDVSQKLLEKCYLSVDQADLKNHSRKHNESN